MTKPTKLSKKESTTSQPELPSDVTAALPEPAPAIKITEVNLANAPNTKKDHDYRPVMFAGCMDLEARRQVCVSHYSQC